MQGVDPAPRPRQQRTWLRDTVEVLLIAFVLYIAIWTCLQTVRVDGESMVGTLQNNDLLLASKISYRFGDPQRGDIVILIPPTEPDRDFIKRVIAVPGDQLEIDGNYQGSGNTAVLIKPGGKGPWQKLDEPYLPEKWTVTTMCCDSNGRATAAPTPVTLGATQYFVMGDNRNRSSDSRAFGFIERDKIIAKAFMRIWPLGAVRLGSGPTLVPGAVFVLPWYRVRRRRRAA